VLGERGYVMATLGTGYNTRKIYDAYRQSYVAKFGKAPGADRFAYLGLVAVAHDRDEARRRGVAFRALDLDRIRQSMKQPVLIDLRNVYRPDEMALLGFVYDSIGRAKAGE